MPQTQAPLRLAILISGRGSNMEAVLQHIQARELQIEVCGVISDKPDASGLTTAKRFGLSTKVVPREKTQTREDYDRELTATVRTLRPDIVLLAGFMRVVGSEFIAAFSNRIVNIHPSLLPAFRGLHAQRQALDAGVRFAGCTVHLVVEQVDAGPILAQAVVPVLPDDTEDSLSLRILAQEHMILPAVIEAISVGKICLPRGNELRASVDADLCHLHSSESLRSIALPK